MLRPTEAQAVLRTVFSLWCQHHSYLRTLFRLRIRAQAFLKSHLATRVLRCWTRAIHTRKKLQLKGLELASTHRRVLKDKTLAGLLANILHRKALRKRLFVADRVYERTLTRRSVQTLKRHVASALWKVDANRSALLAWRNTHIQKSIAAWKEGLKAVTRDKDREARVKAGFRLCGVRRGVHRLRHWSQGKPARERLRLEALFAWKRRSLKSTFAYLLRRSRAGKALRQARGEVQRRAGKWTLTQAIRELHISAQRRKWTRELLNQAENMRNRVNPLKTGFRALSRNVRKVIREKDALLDAEKMHKLQLYRRFQAACTFATAHREEELQQWRRHHFLTVFFQFWLKRHLSGQTKLKQWEVAVAHYAAASLSKVLAQWSVVTHSRSKKSAALTRAKRLLAQKRTKRLLRHWVLRKRHKEESAWKRTMAASQDKLRLFRLLMSVCAQRLHYRRTKEYAAETYHSHFLIQVFEGWRIAIRRKTEIREISKRELGEKSRKVFDAWKLLSRKSHLYEELQKKGRKVRLKWLKIAVLRGLKLYLEMNMGAIAKRRLILQRRQELQATWALQCWKKGITRHKADREKHKFLKSRRNKRVLQKAVREWTSKLQQKAAKRTIKERKTTQARIIVQKLVLRQCYEKWQNYHLKRRRILGKYDLAERMFIRQNTRKFYSKLRLYHRNFRYLRGKLDLADSHSQVSLLRKSLIGLRANITQRSKNKEKLGVALHYWAERRYKMSLEGLMQYRASRRWKGKMEEIALEMRRGDLVSSALGRVQRVGTEWKQERLKVATKARVQKEQRAWKLVAKFAQRWKAKTIQRRKMREIEAIARQKASLLPTQRRASAKEQSVCLQQDGTQARCRPQPRRPAFLSSKPASSFPERPVAPSPSLSIAPPRVLHQSPTSRLEAIEAELMGFKFEKEKVVKYESYVHANPGNTELKAQLGKMKDRLNDRKPRVKALLEEVDRLKSLA